jgi:uncharacterized protein (DUF2141 family)
MPPRIVLLLVLLASLGVAHADETHTITAEITGLTADQATVHVALFLADSGFPKMEKAERSTTVVADAVTKAVRFDGVPAGTYAVALHHDTDGDGDIDFRWFPPGPAEGTSASCADKPLAIPRWKKCNFAVAGDTTVQLPLWY